MATISKFYLLDATSPNTGTMPSNSPTTIVGGVIGAGTEATGASTARDATDTIGTANPDTESSITAAASTSAQRLGHRRFVSRPLAAQTFANADGAWTFSYARSESNTNHNATSGAPIDAVVYLWRPTTGLRVGTQIITLIGNFLGVASAETADSVTANWNGTTAISDGDILVFDVYSLFQQSMATAYTDQFAYNGTTEGSTTTCASFITPPSPVTLFTAAAAFQPRHPAANLTTSPGIV